MEIIIVTYVLKGGNVGFATLDTRLFKEYFLVIVRGAVIKTVLSVLQI